jgi:hypothetical protein
MSRVLECSVNIGDNQRYGKGHGLYMSCPSSATYVLQNTLQNSLHCLKPVSEIYKCSVMQFIFKF